MARRSAAGEPRPRRRRVSPQSRRTVPASWACSKGDHRVMRTLITMNEEGLLGRLPAGVGAYCLPLAARHLSHLHGGRALDLSRRRAASPVAGEIRGDAAGPHGPHARRGRSRGALSRLPAPRHRKGLRGPPLHPKGAQRARPCVERLGMSAERVERVVFLVKQHLAHVPPRPTAGPLGPQAHPASSPRCAATVRTCAIST